MAASASCEEVETYHLAGGRACLEVYAGLTVGLVWM